MLTKGASVFTLRVMSNFTGISGRSTGLSPHTFVELGPKVEERGSRVTAREPDHAPPRAMQQRIVRALTPGLSGRVVTVDTLLGKSGLESVMGRASRYAGVKDVVLRFIHRHISPFNRPEASVGSNYKSALRLADQYARAKADGSGTVPEQLERLAGIKEHLEIHQRHDPGRENLEEVLAFVECEMDRLSTPALEHDAEVPEGLEWHDNPLFDPLHFGSGREVSDEVVPIHLPAPDVLDGGGKPSVARTTLREVRELDRGEFGQEALKARREFAQFVKSEGGRNIMGVLQEAPLDDYARRGAILEERLSQSGSTYVEHATQGGVAPKAMHVVPIPLGDRVPTNWDHLRKTEIGNAIVAKAEALRGLKAEVALSGMTPELDDAIKRETAALDALKKDQSLIHKTLDNRGTARTRFEDPTGAKGTWGGAKKLSGTSDEARAAMKEARWQRQEFMEEALTETASRYLSGAAAKMGCTPPLKIVELYDASPDPITRSQYLDGRSRRFQLQLDGEAAKTYGPTLTVSFLAPGSTEDTSDIDMQFIVEENPAACSELIATFQTVASESLAKRGITDRSLAEVFDTNPYPAGFVHRPELGSNFHFSDTYTATSMDQKRTVDGGLALLRRLDSSSNPRGTIDLMTGGLKGGELDAMMRSLSVGVEVSLKAQLDRATALLGKEGARALVKDLGPLIEEGRRMNDLHAWSKPGTPDKAELAAKLALSRQMAKAMDDFAHHSDGQKRLVAEARNEVYLRSLREVEEITVARDRAVVSCGQKVLEVEQRLHVSDGNDDGLVRAHKAAVGEMREATSELGVRAFITQGIALHHADEAYTNRGAIGHVVEEQMGRQFVKTSGSASPAWRRIMASSWSTSIMTWWDTARGPRTSWEANWQSSRCRWANMWNGSARVWKPSASRW